MKNFRKVLALVLVIATLFSFASIAGATFAELDKDAVPEAETPYYEDEANIEYLEAVRILSYCGILNGYTDGTFQAKNNIRRDEMAKMIAVLANAGYDVEELYAAAIDFEDVPADQWAASYIAYCAKTGIVAGTSATTFSPDKNITGLETAKMLLVVLGFDAKEQGYVGSDWKVNVLRDAKVMGLLEGFAADYDVDDLITRDEASNMMLNALKSHCVVGFLSDNVITITNTLMVNKYYDHNDLVAINSYATLKDAFVESDADGALYGNVVISDTILSEVLFDLYYEVTVDCFGRPGISWFSAQKRQRTELGHWAFDPYFASYYTDVDTVEETLFGYHKGHYDFVLTVDGVAGVYAEPQDMVDVIEAELNPNGVNAGKGVVVEIYIVEDTIYVAMIHTYIGKVAAVNMAKGNVTLGELNYKTITVDNEWGFNAQDVKDETVVLFWQCEEHKVHDVEVIEPEIVEVNRADVDGRHNHSFTSVDGEEFEYAATFGEWLGGHMMDEATDATGRPIFDFHNHGNREHEVYTDKYGYVMWTDLVDDIPQDIVVIDGDSWFSEESFWTADGIDYEINTCDFVYFEDGAPIKTVDTTFEFNFNGVGVHGTNKDWLALVQYVEDDDIRLSRATEMANVSNQNIWLDRGSVFIGAQDASHEVTNYLVNKDTQIIVRVPDYFGEEDDDYTYMYFDGIDEIDAEYAAEEFQYVLDNEWGLEGSGRYYAYIYIDAVYAKETNRAFILKSAGSTVIMLQNGIIMGGDKYEAIVNGEEAIVVYQDMAKQVANILAANGRPVLIASELVLVGWTLDDMPVWAEASKEAPLSYSVDADFIISGGVLSWNDGTTTTVDWNGLMMDDECEVWIAKTNKKGEYEAELISQDEFNDYRLEYGWNQVAGFVWAMDVNDESGRTDGLYDYLLIVVEPYHECFECGADNRTNPDLKIGDCDKCEGWFCFCENCFAAHLAADIHYSEY